MRGFVNKTLVIIIFMSCAISVLAQNIAPEVTNVTFTQRTDGSGIVDIYYDVQDAEGDTLYVSMKVSDDGGSSWNFTCDQTSGDIGEEILTGNNKHIIWLFGDEHPDFFCDQIMVQISADDRVFGTVTDIDGNVYQTILIGDQWWMSENLKVTHYCNGDAIPNVTDNITWGNNTGEYCVYNNNPSIAETYGNLYNWGAVVDNRNIAPEGWHVPTDEEIIELEMALGMSESEANSWSSGIAGFFRGTNEGSKLASRADLWVNGALENNAEFDTSGICFLPGGSRYSTGYFDSMGGFSKHWSSSVSGGYPIIRGLSYYYTGVYRGINNMQDGLSVRCVRD